MFDEKFLNSERDEIIDQLCYLTENYNSGKEIYYN